MKCIFLCIMLAFAPIIGSAKLVRTIYLSEKDIAKIYLKKNESTVIRFDHAPSPGIIGKKNSFLVETHRNVVAIKPSRRDKTNLFIFTKEGQFNFRLISSLNRADTLVYVKRKRIVNNTLLGRLNKKSYPFKLSIKKVTLKEMDSVVSIDFMLSLLVQKDREYLVNGFKFSIYQNRNKIPLKILYSDAQAMNGENLNIKGHIIVNKKHIASKRPLFIKLKHKDMKKNIWIKIPIN